MTDELDVQFIYYIQMRKLLNDELNVYFKYLRWIGHEFDESNSLIRITVQLMN
jgi:hypothetical protein